MKFKECKNYHSVIIIIIYAETSTRLLDGMDLFTITKY